MIERVTKGIDTCSTLGAYLSALSMMIIVGLIIVEIVLRTFFHTSTFIADEYSGYLMVAVVMSGLGFALKTESHIKISVLTSRFSPKVKLYFEVITSAVAIALTLFALYHAVLMVLDSYEYDMRADSISETQLYLPQIFVAVGFTGLALQLVALFMRRLTQCLQTR